MRNKLNDTQLSYKIVDILKYCCFYISNKHEYFSSLSKK